MSSPQEENANQIAPPAQEQPPPEQEQPPPAQEQPPPAQEQPPPAQEQPPPAQEQPPPAQEQPPPAQEQPPPAQEQPPPEQEQPPPAQEQPPPAQEQPPPAQEQPPPAQEQPPPAQEQPPPAQEQPPPEQEQPPPAQEQPPPAQEQPPPAQEQPPPAQEQPPPAQEQPPPAQEQPPPAQEQPPPAQEQPPPAQEQPPPAQEQPPPAQEQPPPAQEQPPPAQEQPPPAQEQPPPEQEQPPPAQDQDEQMRQLQDLIEAKKEELKSIQDECSQAEDRLTEINRAYNERQQSYESLQKEIQILENKKKQYQSNIERLIRNLKDKCSLLSRCLNDEENIKETLNSINDKILNDSFFEHSDDDINDQQVMNELDLNIPNSLSELSRKEKLRQLINEKNYNITIHEFNNLVFNIQNADDDELFQYMVNLYEHYRVNGIKGLHLIFSNFEYIDPKKLQTLYHLKDFDPDYLNRDLRMKMLMGYLLFIDLIECFRRIILNNEKMMYGKKEEVAPNINVLDGIESKMKFYMITNMSSNKMIFDDGIFKCENYMFSSKDNITNITIPHSLKEIENSAFHNCQNLVVVNTNSAQLEKIGQAAFSGCINLIEFRVPDSVDKIENRTFYNCKKMRNIFLSKNLTMIGDEAFQGCEQISQIVIPKTVGKIGKAAFKYCKNLALFVIHNVLIAYQKEKPEIDESPNHNLSFILQDSILEGCEKLLNINFLSIKELTIGKAAFGSMGPNKDEFEFIDESELIDITFNISSKTVFEANAFEKSKLKKINFFASGNVDLELGEKTFVDCKYLQSFNFENIDKFGESKLKFNSGCFINCQQLTNFNFPINSEIVKGEYLFDRCENIKSIVLPPTLNGIPIGMCRNCNSLESCNLNNAQIVSIGDSAFENCSMLVIDEIPASVTKIGEFSFKNCKSLNIKTLPEKTAETGKNSFENCESIVEMTIPSNTKVDSFAFKGCSGLETLIISKGATIKSCAFSCSHLKSVEIFEECNFEGDAIDEHDKNEFNFKIIK